MSIVVSERVSAPDGDLVTFSGNVTRNSNDNGRMILSLNGRIVGTPRKYHYASFEKTVH